jgi:hypothetical protein
LFTSEQLPELRRKIRAQAALEARVLDELVKQAAGTLIPDCAALLMTRRYLEAHQHEAVPATPARK